MRLSARLVIAALAVLVTGLAAGCTAAPGAAEANDARPAARGTTPGSPTASKPAKVEPQAATASDKPSAPAVPPLKVVGAPRGVQAKEGILADAATGQLLWAKSAGVERPMASITKVMTAYLVIQAGDVDRDIKVPRGVENYVFEYGASSDGLHPGEVLTVRQLLYGLLLQSGADAAYTLASTYGPGMKAFIAKMNATARQLGMLHTHFASPDGLPYPTESSTYSTPDDLLRLGEVAMQSPLFRSIVDTPFYSMKKGDGHAAHWWDNDNPLIGEYPGAIGIKTGFTDLAGHCLLFEAVRHGRPLIGVVLGSPPTGPAAAAQDATKVLNWGFSLKQSA
jgi:serine-type D-Ala-D-Ala carboxypeptidase (penicillin-binding protein 5/6)